jgi:hypothetical protein
MPTLATDSAFGGDNEIEVSFVEENDKLSSTALSRIPLTSFQRGKPDAKIAEPLPSAFEVALSSLGVSLFGPGDLSGCLGQQLLL